MEYPFEKLQGRRVLLDTPERPKSAIELTPETEKLMNEEFGKKFTRMRIYAVGEDVETWKVGDYVFVARQSLDHAEIIDIEGSIKLMIAEHEIVFKWKEGPGDVKSAYSLIIE